MFELALESPSLFAELEDSSEVTTLVDPRDGLAPGAVLGGRYRIRNLLGRGGMGEVWRAFDLKLRVDVALKKLLHEWTESERALETLRQEVRSAREVVSPHVCRVFDLIEIDGQELVSMEYIDGITLGTILRRRAPLDLVEAREIALQLLAGIEAIHEADLVHRDIKPENIMVTRAGRVVVMDLGIAKGLAEVQSGLVAGTPAYMAPEQGRGESVTSRADVFSVGVVLAEMVAPNGLQTPEAQRRLWQGIRRQPPDIPESPWALVIERAVRERAGDRYPGAQALARALEEVTLRVAGDEDVRPYPGLASFTEKDAEYFFGREFEVEEMWKKLQRPHLLGLIGPSGAGKSSFLRAGLLPVIPTGWKAVVATPGSQPFKSLAQALIPEFAGDAEAMRELLHFEDPDLAVSLVSRWRERQEAALLIVDQFEELFTQNPPEVEEGFAELLGRLAIEADVHVLVAMRDDFLFRCHPHEPLRPLLSELTLLGPPTGAALRRALVQPALKCGYRFDDETLVDEMVAEITTERGALPLLAFAAARLWKHRDRSQGLLTREAYEHVGGVGGALVQHAEATLESIGHEHLPIVRELFRNLVTAQGTRATREEKELLSVFVSAERDSAARVLAALVDARLLTTYEEPADDAEAPRTRIEIIHESLLSNWPRMVRWRTQDADSAQLRDQLRQVAALWIERGRPEDLLWTGTSFREYELWRERYAGGLSDSEEEFASAMRTRAERRQRRRRLATATVLVAALAVASAMGLLWRRSEASRRAAEAGELLSLGRLHLEGHPTAAFAYALASLEKADNVPARRFAVEALWRSPMAFVIPESVSMGLILPEWSSDGRWLAMGGSAGVLVRGRDGDESHLVDEGGLARPVGFSADGTRLVTRSESDPVELHLWSIPEAELLTRWPVPGLVWQSLVDRRLVTLEPEGSGQAGEDLVFRERWIDAPEVRTLGPGLRPELPVEPEVIGDFVNFGIDPSGGWLATVEDGSLLRRSLGESEESYRVLGHSEPGVDARARAWSDRIVVGDETGRVEVLDAGSGRLERTLRSPTDARRIALHPSRQLIAAAPTFESVGLHVFDLEEPRGADPVALRHKELQYLNGMAFHPRRAILAAGNWPLGILLWNLGEPRALTWRNSATSLAFTPQGALVAQGPGTVRLWPLTAGPGGEVRTVADGLGSMGSSLSVSPDGRFAVVAVEHEPRILKVPLDGSAAVVYEVGERGMETTWGSLDPEGRRAAVGTLVQGEPQAAAIRIADLETGEVRELRADKDAETCTVGRESQGPVQSPYWLPDGRLVSDGGLGLRLWNLEDDSSRQLRPCRDSLAPPWLEATADSRTVLVLTDPFVLGTGQRRPLTAFDLETGRSRDLVEHGNRVTAFALDASGTMVATGDAEGLVRVGPLAGGEPHLLYGHTRKVQGVAISPDGRWIASASLDGTIRVWPLPDTSQDPLHTLPYDDLLRKLRGYTNLRVVEDPDSATGTNLVPGRFAGWEEIPEW